MIAGNIKYLVDMVDAGETNDMSDDMIIGYSAALKQLAENVAFNLRGAPPHNARFDKNRFIADCGFKI